MNTKITSYAKKNLKLLLAFISVLILLFTYSCKDEASILGADLLPNDDKMGIKYDSTITFNGYLVDKAEYSTKYYSSHYIGQINDPYFGKTTASIATQYILTSTSITFDYAVVDSAVLYLRIDSVYGSFDKSKEIKVYELSKSLSSSNDSVYLSSTPITNYYVPENLISTGTSYQGDTLVKISLSGTFASSLILSSDFIYYYRTVDKFLEKYLGIALLYDETTELGGLLKLSMTSSESGIKLYYKKPDLTGDIDTLTFSYKLSGVAVNYNNIQHDYSTGTIQTYIDNDSTLNDSLLFIQGLGGMTSKLVFSNLSNWPEEDKFSILSAELYIPVLQDDNISSLIPPSNLYFIYSDSDTNYFQVEDYSIGEYFSGSYNKTNNEYKFDISRHLKNLLYKEIEDSCLYIRILNSNFYPNRVILKTKDNIKLKVTYSKF